MEGVKFARDDLIDRLDECETTLRGARNRIGELDDELASTQVSAETMISHFIFFFKMLLSPFSILSTLHHGTHSFHSIYFYYLVPRGAYGAQRFTTSYCIHIHF